MKKTAKKNKVFKKIGISVLLIMATTGMTACSNSSSSSKPDSNSVQQLDAKSLQSLQGLWTVDRSLLQVNNGVGVSGTSTFEVGDPTLTYEDLSYYYFIIDSNGNLNIQSQNVNYEYASEDSAGERKNISAGQIGKDKEGQIILNVSAEFLAQQTVEEQKIDNKNRPVFILNSDQSMTLASGFKQTKLIKVSEKEHDDKIKIAQMNLDALDKKIAEFKNLFSKKAFTLLQRDYKSIDQDNKVTTDSVTPAVKIDEDYVAHGKTVYNAKSIYFNSAVSALINEKHDSLVNYSITTDLQRLKVEILEKSEKYNYFVIAGGIVAVTDKGFDLVESFNIIKGAGSEDHITTTNKYQLVE